MVLGSIVGAMAGKAGAIGEWRTCLARTALPALGRYGVVGD